MSRHFLARLADFGQTFGHVEVLDRALGKPAFGSSKHGACLGDAFQNFYSAAYREFTCPASNSFDTFGRANAKNCGAFASKTRTSAKFDRRTRSGINGIERGDRCGWD